MFGGVVSDSLAMVAGWRCRKPGKESVYMHKEYSRNGPFDLGETHHLKPSFAPVVSLRANGFLNGRMDTYIIN